MPLLRRRPNQNLKSQVYYTQLQIQVEGGARLEFKFCLVGLGKDAVATASTDWIAFQPRTRCQSMPHPRRHKTTPKSRHLAALVPALRYQLRRFGHSTQCPHVVWMDWGLRHPTWRPSTELSFLTPRRNSGSAE